MKLNLNEINYILCETIKLLTEITVQNAYSKYYANIDEETFKYILSVIQPNDKNNLHKNTQWVLGLYQKEPDKIFNSLPLLSNENNNGYLQIFNRLCVLNMLQNNERDIKRYPTIESLAEKISQFNYDDLWGDNSDRKKRVLRQEFKDAKDNIQLIYEDDIWKVLVPKSYEASVYWGDNTKWCTAYKDDKSYYEEYSSQGPLYININKQTKEKYQFHFETSSFKDKNDEEISGDNLFETINATTGMIKAYKKILSNDIFNTLLTPHSIIYENDYFKVITQYRLVYTDDIFWDTETHFETPPLTLIYKADDSKIDINYGIGSDGFSHFYCLKQNKYLIGIVDDEGDAFFHILTLNEIMQKCITENMGEFYGQDYYGEVEAKDGTLSDMVLKHPETKDIIMRIDENLL